MSRRFREPEPQHVTANGWTAARIRGRDFQHGYLLMYRGQYAGWLMHQSDGWRWLLTWQPSTVDRPPRFGIERVSRRAYPTWQAAAGHLARTDVGRLIAGIGNGPRVTAWEPIAGEPWVPRPAVLLDQSPGRAS
ncbi:hypothetical protein [Saccharopolyspora hattusasensis]|uniref:hypothetical protein n=1 Tax=Saccharopolyspora hattusasensis TaxID=1128679 RepID=UPI003D96332C